MAAADLANTFINLTAAVLVGMGGFQPVMSPSTSTERGSFLLVAVVQCSKDQDISMEEPCGQPELTAAVAGGQLSPLAHWCDK